MGNKIRGALAILVGLFGFFLGFRLFQHGSRGLSLWLLLAAALVLLVIGCYRVIRKPFDPTAQLLK